MQPAEQLRHLEKTPGGVSFREKIQAPLFAEAIRILQLNVGYRCNLACRHCHVGAGPYRRELMDRDVFERCLRILERYPVETVDITGGAPEMNPRLPWFIKAVARLKRRVMVRSNLVILREAAYRHFAPLYREHGVEIVASLPDLRADRVDRQRGPAVFERVIAAMRDLNDIGYGRPDSGLKLDLVYNPVGAYLPGTQQAIEHEYRQRLSAQHGVTFNTLFSLTNCPVGRYLEFLIRSENYDDYMASLISTFNRQALPRVMCRSTLSVGWNGRLYDCDFNQMLKLPVDHGAPNHIRAFDFERLRSRQIVIHNHCFSCTAGAGSSCQGALDE